MPVPSVLPAAACASSRPGPVAAGSGPCSPPASPRGLASELPPSPAVPAEVHATIAAKVLGCGLQESGTHRTPYGLGMLNGDAAGNNLLHAAPELRGPALLESPELDGVLRSLLGPGYRMHPHCRGHLRRKGAQTTMWHIDAYKGTAWSSGRQHEPHWLMIC